MIAIRLSLLFAMETTIPIALVGREITIRVEIQKKSHYEEFDGALKLFTILGAPIIFSLTLQPESVKIMIKL